MITSSNEKSLRHNVEGRSFPVEVRYRPLTDEPVTSSDDDSYDDFEENHREQSLPQWMSASPTHKAKAMPIKQIS